MKTSDSGTVLAQGARLPCEALVAGVVQSIGAGFTDPHFFPRGKGIVSYGFASFANTREDRDRVHGDNERIPVKNHTDTRQRRT